MPVKLFDTNKNALDISFIQFSGGERHVQLGTVSAHRDKPIL